MTLLALVALPLVMAVVMLLLRGLPIITTPLSVVTLLVMAVLCLLSQQVGPLTVLGRSIGLSPLEAAGLAFCAVVLALMVLNAYRSSRGSWAHSLTLLTMGFFTAGIMVRSMTIGELLLEMGTITAVMLLLSGRLGAAMTSMRTLIVLTLSSLLLLLAAWALEGQAAAPEYQLSANVGIVALALGFGIALAIAPFHIWQPPVFYSGEPLATVMLSVVFGIVVLLRLSAVSQVSTWPGGRELFSTLLLGGGGLTVFVGGATALLQRTVNRALAYAALADMGMVIIGLGMNTRAGFSVAAVHLVYRGLAIAVVSISLGVLRQCLGGDDVTHLAGAVRRAPLAVISMMIGGFSLAGLPLTAGFTTRLLLYRAFASQYADWTIPIVLCSFGPAWAFTRCVAAALVSTPVAGGRREPFLSGLLAFVLSLILLALGIYPSLLSLLPKEWLSSLASALFVLRGWG